VADHLGPDVPLHFVRFHPAYKYTQVGRTPVAALLRAREIAFDEGIQFCYLGNLYQPGVSDTICLTCGNVLVQRFGLTVTIGGLAANGACSQCGTPGPIREPFAARPLPPVAARDLAADHFQYSWNEEVNSIHVVAEQTGGVVALDVVSIPGASRRVLRAGGGLARVILSRASGDETGVVVRWPEGTHVRFLPVLDRAHYPVFGSSDPAVVELMR
jgi:pyruvate formate lyase activating enzyme